MNSARPIDLCASSGTTEHLTRNGVRTICGVLIRENQNPAGSRRCLNCYPPLSWPK